MQERNFEGPHDIIILGRDTMNRMGKKRALKLLSQLSDVLKPTGRIVLYETLSETDAAEPAPHIQLRSLTMFVTRRKGKVHDRIWFKDLLSEAGFVSPTISDLHPFTEKLLVSFRNIIVQPKMQAKKHE